MSSKVEVLCPNGHRVYVKTTPNTTLIQILEEACTKKGFDPPEFDLIHGRSRKSLDLTLTVRFAGLSNNAKLEIVKAAQKRTQSNVTLALQLNDGERLKDSFTPFATLWDILEHFEKEHSKNLCTGKSEAQVPVCVYMREEVIGEFALRETSLKSLGLLSGTAIIRLIYKDVEDETLKDIKEKINKEKSRQKKIADSSQNQSEVVASCSNDCQMDTAELASGQNSSNNQELMETESSQSVRPDNSSTTNGSQLQTAHFSILPSIFPPDPPADVRPRRQDKFVQQRIAPQPIFTEFKFPEATKGMSLYDNDMTSAREVLKYTACERNIICYDMSCIKTSSAVPIEPDDAFFELTVSDVQQMYQEQQHRMKEEDTTSLMTNSMRRSQTEQHLAKYDYVFIRFTFPDNLVLQATFRPKEPIYNLYKFIKEQLHTKDQSFYLYTSPPKSILKDRTETLLEANLVPMTIVYVGSKDKIDQFLSDSVKSQMMSQFEANKKIVESMHHSVKRAAGSVDEGPSRQSRTHHDSNPASDPKVPKWFKVGKK